MHERDETRTQSTTPSHLATVALHALANYKKSGLAGKGERMHEQLAVRLARVAVANDWEA